MDRRQFLAAWKEKMAAENHFEIDNTAAASPNASLLPYSGAWTKKEVTHLLRRATFGVKKSDVTAFLALTPSQAVDQLLLAEPMPSNPVNDFESTNPPDSIDGNVAAGADWTTASGEGNIWYRHLSYDVWVMKNAMDQRRTLREKMTLFWNNHFGTSKAVDGAFTDNRRYFKNFNLYRANALGNVKTLVNLVTKDAQMLQFLSGQDNTKDNPNENYAREVQELFVVGKYPSQQYSENDVREAARLLTGWKYDEPNAGKFVEADHDTGAKTFSAFYNNTVITGQSGAAGGQTELDAFLNMLFAKADSANFICRKLYRFFVQYKISADVEATIISQLASTFRNNNFEIKPVLSQLLKSQHFFDIAYNGSAIIKSPMDLYAGLMKTFRTQSFAPASISDQFAALVGFSDLMDRVQMPISQPPNVAGYGAYTSPLYDRYWISTVTLPRRANHLNDMLNNQVYPFYDIMGFTNDLASPGNPNLLISETLDLLYATAVGTDVVAYLKNILLSGQTNDYYWTNAWNTYKVNPSDSTAYGTVFGRLSNFFNYLINLEEIHLM